MGNGEQHQLPSATCHDFNDFQPVASRKLTLGKFRRGNRLSVVFDHHAARQEFLRHEELLDGAGQLRLDWLPVRYDIF